MAAPRRTVASLLAAGHARTALRRSLLFRRDVRPGRQAHSGGPPPTERRPCTMSGNRSTAEAWMPPQAAASGRFSGSLGRVVYSRNVWGMHEWCPRWCLSSQLTAKGNGVRRRGRRFELHHTVKAMRSKEWQ